MPLNRIDVPGLSGERFRVIYHLSGTRQEAEMTAQGIALEQTVEFPDDLVPLGDIQDSIVGQIETLDELDDGRHAVTISYAVETAGDELTQLLNVIFGNSSIKPGIRVESFDLPASLLAKFKGPRFGKVGIRDLVGVADRPLLCTALKPMGLSPEHLADQAYQFALGGIDVIKDDHGLANQPFCPYEERVLRCAEAVAKANAEMGRAAIYMPHISAPADKLVDRALFAKQAGAGGLLVCPGLIGMDAMRLLADDDRIDLPIMSHPAFQGSFVVSPDSGLSHYALYGEMMRLAGADATVYPNYGGRFSFSRSECRAIVAGCTAQMDHIKPIFPTPGGGMGLDRIADMHQVYGTDVIYLIGGGLHRAGPDLVENSRRFNALVSQLM